MYTWKLDGVPEKNGTETYIRITDFYMRPDLGSIVTLFKNDNPESRELSELTFYSINISYGLTK